MIINHNIAHYVIGGAALLLASYGALSPAPAPVHEAAIHQIQKPSRSDWASLGQDKTEALGEALKGVKVQKVRIYCNRPSCHDLALDLDDAFQIAGWQSDFEDRAVDSEDDRGLFVGPPGEAAEALAAALEKSTGLQATVVPIDNIDGIGIIIGRTGPK
jgi:hypothetical protein